MSKSAIVWTGIIIIILIIIGIVVYNSGNTSTLPVAATSSTATQGDQSGAMPAPEENTGTATSSMSATTTPVSSTTKGSVVLTAVANPTLGAYLVGSNGMTVYTSAADSANTSTCTGSCAAAWPPYTVDASVVSFAGGNGVRGAISAITRADGSKQLTYNGLPLYFWQGDKKPGDTTGNGVGGFSIVRE